MAFLKTYDSISKFMDATAGGRVVAYATCGLIISTTAALIVTAPLLAALAIMPGALIVGTTAGAASHKAITGQPLSSVLETPAEVTASFCAMFGVSAKGIKRGLSSLVEKLSKKSELADTIDCSECTSCNAPSTLAKTVAPGTGFNKNAQPDTSYDVEEPRGLERIPTRYERKGF